jgi:hypothetical protein
MVLFQKYVRWFGLSTKMAPTAKLAYFRTLWQIHIKIFSSETTGPIATKLISQFGCGGHLGRKAEPPDTILEENHPRIISAKFG